MSYNQTNTEYTTGTGTTGTGTGQGGPGIMDRVKNAVHSTGDGVGNTRQTAGQGTGVGGLGNEGVAPGTGGMTSELTGHHGHHHHHGHHTEHQMKQDVQGTGADYGSGMGASSGAQTGRGMMDQVKQHIPGTTEHQVKQDYQGAGAGGVSAAPGAGYDTGAPVGTTHTTHTSHTSTHGAGAGAGTEESMKEKILKHIPGTEERAQYKATGTAAGSAGGAGAGTTGTTGADRAL